MSIPNLYNPEEKNQVITRIDSLTDSTQPQWGKMSVSQMLAHCNVPFEYEFERGKYAWPGKIKQKLLRMFLKKGTVGTQPYKRNSPTGPDFKQTLEKNFEAEKARLINFINQFHDLGSGHFEGKEYHSFGVLTAEEWNVMYAKHLDHHLTQFGV